MTVAADKNVWKELVGFICKGRHPPDQLQIPKPPTLSFSDARAKVPRTEENLTEERARLETLRIERPLQIFLSLSKNET